MFDRLYEKIGGREVINDLVRVFYAKVQVDPRLSKFFAQTDMEKLRAQQVMFITMLLGGSRTFTGNDLTKAHAGARGQGMADTEFDALIEHFQQALVEVGVAGPFIVEILARLEKTRDAVLGR